LASFETALCAE